MNADLGDAHSRVVGSRQLIKSIQKGQIAEVYIALDAENRVTQPVVEAAKQKALPVHEVPTMAELGQLCAIDVGAAVAGCLKA